MSVITKGVMFAGEEDEEDDYSLSKPSKDTSSDSISQSLIASVLAETEDHTPAKAKGPQKKHVVCHLQTFLFLFVYVCLRKREC